jgi:hypothetical protein
LGHTPWPRSSWAELFCASQGGNDSRHLRISLPREPNLPPNPSSGRNLGPVRGGAFSSTWDPCARAGTSVSCGMGPVGCGADFWRSQSFPIKRGRFVHELACTLGTLRFVAMKPTKGMSECSARRQHHCCPIMAARIRRFRLRQLATRYLALRGIGRAKTGIL